MGVLVLNLLLIYSVLNPMFIFSCSSMPLNHLLTMTLGGNETDRLALLAIKANIQHDPNQVMSTWNASIHFCSWYGVTCSRRHHQRVTMPDLKSQGLSGFISPHIGNLSFLREMYLYSNNFTHEIPPEIGRLRRLQVLHLANNSFTGHIPTNISNCFNLTYLSFLSKLQTIDFDHNNFTGEFPPSFGNLSSLTQLSATVNNLVGSIPTSLGQLKKLTFFSLGGNMLSGSMPPSIFNLSAIVSFSVLQNQIQGNLPLSFSDAFPVIKVFSISGNKFIGGNPVSISNATSLVSFDVSRNNLTGRVPSLLLLHNLMVFSVADNHLGSGKDGNLQNLNLSFNDFWGAVPIAGVFKNVSANSVVGNIGLCSVTANLQLPLCKSKESKGGGLSRRMKIMISLESGFTLLGIVVVIYILFRCSRKKMKGTELSTLGNSMLQVSYASLLNATNGFSSTNLIGIGAFGSVYKGILDDDATIVAVKVFNMLHRGASKSFISECEALRNIRHRNLVKILTACSSIDFNGNDFKALVYEFMDNGSLEDWLHPSTGTEELTEAPKSLNLVQRVDIAMDVASALDCLHNHCETPIVHCDLIKPSNVLLDSDLTGHVSDFGLSRFLTTPTTNVPENQSSSIGIRGSVGYAAPEYGMGSVVSVYGDVYSFGILLLEMFTRKRPTDHMFSDGLNLHNYVKTALPECVSEISKSLALQEGTASVVEAHRQLSVTPQKIEECLTLIFGIGIACSTDSPTNRKDISNVTVELKSIRKNLLG